MSDINIVSYSEKAIAVFGNTLPLKSHFESLQGKFNPSLKSPEENVNEKVKGWIFPKSKLEQVKTIVEKYKNNTLKDIFEPKTEKKLLSFNQTQTLSQVNKENTNIDVRSENQFNVTKEMYLALITRIEKLELELSLQNKVIFKESQTTLVSKKESKQVDLDDDDEEVKPKQRLLSKK